jgi:hypothetical protein
MNRIYQGRVSTIQVPDAEGVLKNAPLGHSQSCVLWQHHRTFQDAVNYYLVALGSLADSGSDNRVIRDLRVRLSESWEKFPRDLHGASSLRDSLRRSLPCLPENVSLGDAFVLIRNHQGEEARVGNLASLENLLSSLLEKSGDGKIRNGGASELPKFCCQKTDANFSGEHSRKAFARLRLILTLHGRLDGNLNSFGALDLATASKRANRGDSTGEDARKKLLQFVSKLLKAGWLNASLAEELVATIKALTVQSILIIPAYEAGGESREKSIGIPMLLLGKQLGFPQWSINSLKQLLAEPTKWEQKLEEATSAANDAIDPLEISRGKRGYVFPAFTALPQWSPLSSGEPVWKEFDIAAFKEALKSLNQFNQKTIERNEKLQTAKQTLDYMLGKK